jgi:RHS repeat-associated protein
LRGGGEQQDIVTTVQYDSLGRQVKDYLPYPVVGNSGSFVIDPVSELTSYYLTNFPEDSNNNTINPFSEKRFEASPLNRIIEQGAPGSDWAVDPLSDADHTIKFNYLTNVTSEVRYFTVTFTNGNTESPVLSYDASVPFYSAGALYKTVTRDENWQPQDGLYGTTSEFKDKLGRVILKRTNVYDSHSVPINQTNYHDTYYIYDDFGNLTYVLSPEASGEIIDSANNTLIVNYQQVLDDLGYQYKYDYRNRLIEKKVPGKDWEYIYYDTLDRPVLTQDANLRSDNNKWLFTKYDALGRVVYTGIYTPAPGETRIDIQDNLRIPATTNVSETFSITPTTIGDTQVYYTNGVYPRGINGANLEVLTVNYYDSYIDYQGLTLPTTVYGQGVTTQTKSLPTVSKVRVLGTNNWITTLTAYDDKARVIYIDSYNSFLQSRDKIRNKLDFTGKVLETHTTHNKDNNPTISIIDYFYYDHMGRLLTQKQKIGNEPLQLIAEHHYDALGQLKSKDVGGQTFLDGYTDITHADVTFDGVITKTGTPNSWDAGVKTKGAITINGGVKYTILQENKLISVGLVKTNQNRPNWNDGFDYGLYHTNIDSDNDGEKDVKLIVNGAIQSTIISGYNSGDNFSIERSGSEIIFRKNNVLFTTITDTEEINLVGKVGFKNDGAQISDFQLFGSSIDKKLQKIDYKYNIRGWLTKINDVHQTLKPKLFNYEINYNKITGHPNATALYNGNISQTLWMTNNQDKQVRSYGYDYDDLNRITKAESYQGNTPTTMNVTHHFDLENISYDKNGNILSLKRLGFDNNGSLSGVWDELTYSYTNGNQLLNVDDALSYSLRDYGFKDGNYQPTTNLDDYQYDLNGNLTLDRNKGISAITYNHLNLPETVTINNGTQTGTITYVYDASGVKLQKTVTQQNITPITTQYAGNFVYCDKVTTNNTGSMQLQFFNTPEGYVEPTVEAGVRTEKSVKGFDTGTGTITYSDYKYVFQYKDHLGNIRLSYSDSDLNGAIDPNTEIIEENNYYPFGLKHKGYNNVVTSTNPAQNYKYNGKELNEELGLDWYDYGSRNYQPDLGRWFRIDPLAESFPSWSPYNFTMNNPIRYIDPDGRSPFDVIITGDKQKQVFKQLNQSTSLDLSIDDNGKVSATGTANTQADQDLLTAINDNSVVVNVDATKDNYTAGGNWFVGGAFGGSTVDANGVTQTTQTVNPKHTKTIDKFYGSEKGVTVMHEVLESYFGGRDNPGNGAPTFQDVQNNTPTAQGYLSAHNNANTSDPRHNDPTISQDPNTGHLFINKSVPNPIHPALPQVNKEKKINNLKHKN